MTIPIAANGAIAAVLLLGWVPRAMAPSVSGGVSEASDSADRAMARHAEGDRSAFTELYDILAPALRRYIHRLTHDSSLTEDLLQQTFLHMHDKRGQFLIGAPVRPWAYAIARRLFIDHKRRARREHQGGELEPIDALRDSTTPEDWQIAEQGMAVAALELARLPAAQRDAYLLVKGEGLNPRDAASVLGITAAAVRVRVHRAASAIRAVLGLTRGNLVSEES